MSYPINNPPLIDADYCRCTGLAHEAKCQDCLRRLQALRDPPLGWFPRIGPTIKDGRCLYYMPPKKAP